MKVKELMITSVITIQSRKSLQCALDLMVESNIRRLPVVASGTVIGMIVQHDIEKALRAPEVLLETPVDWVMTKKVISTHPEADLKEAIQLLIDHKISGLPVMDGSKLAGIISETDILRLCMKMLEQGLF